MWLIRKKLHKALNKRLCSSEEKNWRNGETVLEKRFNSWSSSFPFYLIKYVCFKNNVPNLQAYGFVQLCPYFLHLSFSTISLVGVDCSGIMFIVVKLDFLAFDQTISTE